MEVKNQFINSLLIGSLFFYSLDAYSFFDVPFSWIGLSGIFLIDVAVDGGGQFCDPQRLAVSCDSTASVFEKVRLTAR